MTVFIDVEEGDQYSVCAPGFDKAVWAVSQFKKGLITLQNLRTNAETIVNCDTFAEMIARSSVVRSVGCREQKDGDNPPPYTPQHGPESQQDGPGEGVTDA